jgi:Cdc6-like AAA superfamily ATPase
VRLSEGQQQVLSYTAELPICVLTGGPGCGKTLTAQAVVRQWRKKLRSSNDIAMMAPTG